MRKSKTLQDSYLYRISRYLHFTQAEFRKEIISTRRLTEANFILKSRSAPVILQKGRIEYREYGGIYVTFNKFKCWLNIVDYGETWVVLRE